MISFILLWLLSYSPILSFSDDGKYGTITTNIDKLRFSILKIPLGTVVIHFITISCYDIKKIRLFRLVRYSLAQPYYSLEEVNIEINKFKEHINHLEKEEINNEINFLKHKLTLEESTKSKQVNKIILFSTATLAFLPFIIHGYNKNSLIYIGLYIIQIFAFLNMGIWLISFITVKNVIRSNFNDLIDSKGSVNFLAEAIFTDWITIKRETQVEVGYCKNIQKLFIIIMLITTINYVNINSLSFQLPSKKTMLKSQHQSCRIISSLNLQESNDIFITKLIKIISAVKNNDDKKILINYDNKQNFKMVENLVSIIQLYNINIEFIFICDSSRNGANIIFYEIM